MLSQLNKALESIGNLKYDPGDFEVIVVKNLDVEVNVHLSNLKIHSVEKNHPSYKRNLGVKESTGKYLAFVDDDVQMPEDWLEKAMKFIEENNCDGVSGVDCSIQKGIGYRLASAIFFNKLGSGTDCHYSKKAEQTKFYNNALCNCMIKREVWEKVGGFNEIADYHVDDTEFFFIAQRLGFTFYKYPALILNHERKPFWIPYLRKLFHSTVWTGINTMVFPEIYLKIPSIKLMIVGLLICPLIIWHYKIIPVLLLCYLIGIWILHIKYLANDLLIFILIGPAFFMHHFIGMTAFLYGVVRYIFSYGRWRETIDYKNIRYTWNTE